ncbi:peptide deformylase [Patescibacteria group bacterium]|nr:peptide deformylase [Patescibacteria group bacterium]
MHVLKRSEFGNPILRAKAKKVPLKFIGTRAFNTLVADTVYTMRRANGVGLAAPQIGKSMRLAVLETRPTKTRPNLERSGVVVIVNPRIVHRSKALQKEWEGCLSFSDIRGQVPRAKTVVVEYYDECGEKVTAAAQGLWASIFQHEIDHLDGIGFMDRVDTKSFMTLREYKKKFLKK